MRYRISKYSIYTFLFCLIYLGQRAVFISLLNMPMILIGKYIYLHEVLFLITSCFL